MANGSRRNFIYTTDSGAQFAYNADEGWTEAVLASAGAAANAADFNLTSDIEWTLPGNLTPRTVLLQSADGKRKAEVIVPNPTIYADLNYLGSFSVSDPGNTASNTLFLTMKKGERVQIPRGGDTGLTDGDVP